MRKAIAPMGIAILAALVVTATSSAALAQAGSNGGHSSVGKTDRVGIRRRGAPYAGKSAKSRSIHKLILFGDRL